MKQLTILLSICSLTCLPLYGQNALSFDGVNDYVDCGNNTSLQITGSALTIEAWIYANSWETNVWQGTLVVKEQNGPGTDNGYMLRAGENGRLNLTLGNGNWTELISAQGTLSTNTWHHVAGTYDGSYLRLYVDGIQVDSLASSISISNSTNGVIVGGNAGGSRNFDGLMDEIRIWNVARTKAEIVASMNTELCGSPAGLQAYYTFNQGTAGGSNATVTTLLDRVGSNDGTLSHFALTGSFSNWVTGVNLTVPGTQVSLSDTICNGSIYTLGGQSFNTTGMYQVMMVDMHGCDSLINLDLTVKDPVNTVVSRQGLTFTANAAGPEYTYQWIDCQTSSILAGETSQVFVATTNGDFAVVITEDGCSDTSACFTVSGIGIEERVPLEVRAFPNPVSNVLLVQWNDYSSTSELRLLDGTGRVLQMYAVEGDLTEVDMSTYPKGVYWLELNDGVSTYTLKILK